MGAALAQWLRCCATKAEGCWFDSVRDKQRFGAVDERAELERGIVNSDIVVWCLVSTESGR